MFLGSVLSIFMFSVLELFWSYIKGFVNLFCPRAIFDSAFLFQVSVNTQLVRSHGRSIHKRSTLEILVRGKILGDAARMFSQPHRFEKHTYTTSTFCDYCSQMLWGLSKTGKIFYSSYYFLYTNFWNSLYTFLGFSFLQISYQKVSVKVV